MRLTSGQHAPDFSISDITGKTISLHDYAGKKTLLCFFRYAGCPFCNLQMSKLIARYDNFSTRGLSVIAFFQSPQDTVLQYPGKQKPQFPLVPDPNKTVYSSYGIESSPLGLIATAVHIPTIIEAAKFGQPPIDGDLFLMPATILIKPDQTVYKANYATSLAEKLPIFDIEEFLLTS